MEADGALVWSHLGRLEARGNGQAGLVVSLRVRVFMAIVAGISPDRSVNICDLKRGL